MEKNSLANLIASKFIARTDVKAVQKILPTGDCIYIPHTKGPTEGRDYLPWNRSSLLSHLERKASYGHYLLNTNNECKFFAFDIDLEKKGTYPSDPWRPDEGEDYGPILEFNPREAWKDRSHPSRRWLKHQLRMLAGLCGSAIYAELEIPVTAYYSGSKGIHVYGFTGLVPAADAREAARIVLESMDCWKLLRGNNFYCHTNIDTFTGYPNFSLEVFPKQDTIGNLGLGNLMRVPLGCNLKNKKDPTFFIDLADTDYSQLKPLNPELALTTNNPWEQ